MLVFFALVMIFGAYGLELPANCNRTQFYDPGSLACLTCPANSSMVRSSDGFGCSCEEHSIPSSPNSCKPCNATAVVSDDGSACVPRKCQNTAGRVVCRKCPSDYISVTQNFDGSSMREVLCVKCARGYKAIVNKCVRCESCNCARHQVVVRGICVPKAYVNTRPKYEEKLLHPLELLDIVKHEYLCTQNDIRACRSLANDCVKSFYSADLGGPCRLWLQPKTNIPTGLPPLIIAPSGDTNPGETIITRQGKDYISLALAVYTFGGGMMFIHDTNQQINPCQLPINIRIGEELSLDCPVNTTKVLASNYNETLAPFLYIDGEYIPLPVTIIKPNGYNVQRGTWKTDKFRRYFIVHNSISTTTNVTNTVYLRTLSVRLRLERVKHTNGSLRVTSTIEVQYATKSMQEDTVTATLKVEHDLPSAGVIRGLEVWGGLLGTFLTLFALAQWRGSLQRGALHYTVVPLLAGSIADTLYFAALFSTLHALAAEAGTLGMTLPLSHSEERIIKAFLYSAVGLKALKVVWINWKQCTCDIFFLDWSEYNPPVKEILVEKEKWKATILAKEWSLMQAIRRAPPGYTVPLALLILHLMSSWKSLLPQNDGYKWAVVSIAWWSAYGVVLLAGWLKERFWYSQVTTLPNICTGVGLSLLIFQEENYAHYVHGVMIRKTSARWLDHWQYAELPVFPKSGILAETESRHALLSRFLAAFFERSLDGLNWVASERTVLERLLDVELVSRESGGTSVLLHDDDSTPSCIAMTWWGEEWNLSKFDAMLFSCVFVASDDAYLAALLTVIVWQSMKLIRAAFGNKNQTKKTGVDIYFI